ncbi:DNA (cytosine-5-)-methyltransferase [Corynebacterium flavescens]
MNPNDEFAVKQVRGPYVKLPKHPDHCETVDELVEYAKERKKSGAVLGVDLFAGAGGLSQGLADAGIEVILGVDHYEYAVETHAARFPGISAPWDMSTAESIERIVSLMKEADIDVLAGGPPCQPFSKAGRNGIRHLVEQGLRDPIDQRRNLWRAYLEVAQLARPRAVIMENVPDMALDDEMFIMRSIIEELEQLGYTVESKVIDTWRYGVPQFRQRYILVALRDGIAFSWPQEVSKKVTVWNAIGDMPEVEGGWRPEGGADGWIQYEGPKTEFQKYIRRGVPKEQSCRLYDHITRPVREDDRIAFEMMTAETKYSELPANLQRYRSDIFNDKYKRLDENDLSRTITAHISKDGYGFIHPRQSRTLTVREAARLQTFPDDFRFSGPPSAAFKQIGNAVPVRLGENIGRGVLEALSLGEKKGFGSAQTALALASWYRSIPERDLTRPWIRDGNRWRILVCEIFMERTTLEQVRLLWPLIKSLPAANEEVGVSQTTKETILAVFQGERFEKRRRKFESLASSINEHPEAFWAPGIDLLVFPSLNPALKEILELASPQTRAEDRSEEPVIVAKGVLRVTSRFQGIDTESRNKQSDGRISIARLIGLNENSRSAHLALFELGRTVCVSEMPRCSVCPLQQWCVYAQSETSRDNQSQVLF